MTAAADAARCEALLLELFGQDQFAIKLGLEAMQEAARVEGLGPCARVTVHIAGTNGKGTTSSALTALCHAAGLRTGLYTSPHLVSFHERIRVGTRPLSDGELAALLDPILMRHGGRRGPAVGLRPLTYFEIATLVAWRCFSERDLDVAIIETGLGGRLDATNTIPKELTAITNIALDHEAFLGNTVADIAREKFGICRTDVPLLVHADAAGAREVAALAEVHGVPLEQVQGGVTAREQNLALAHRLFEQVADRLGLPPGARMQAIERAARALRWPGRQEELAQGGRALLVDGAHNRNGVEASAAWLRSLGWSEERKITAIVGLTADRDPAAILAPLRPLVDRWVTVSADNPKSTAASTLAERLAGFGGVLAEEGGIAAALDATEGEPVLVVGSLYLVGDLFAALGKRAADLAIFDEA
jgi:dihydrofolate synthase/folylpolyglutamate synthase